MKKENKTARLYIIIEPERKKKLEVLVKKGKSSINQLVNDAIKSLYKI